MKGWRKFRLGDGCITNANSYTPKEKWKFVNYLDTGNITDNKIDAIQYIDIGNEKLPSRARRKVQENSIIYSTVRPKQRHFGIIKNHPDNFLVSTGFVVIDVNESILDADFLYYLLTQNKVVEKLHIIAEQSVSTYPSIKPSDIENLEISIPDIVVQKQIASILGCLDKKIEQNNTINKNLEQQAQTIFQERFQHHDNLPERWKTMTLADVSIMSAGGDKPNTISSQKTSECQYPIYSNGISNDGLYGYSSDYKFDTESVTVSARGTIGFVCLRHIPYTPIVRLVTLIPHTNLVSAKYLYLWLKSIPIHGTGTTQQQLTVPDFRKTEIIVPSESEMRSFTDTVTPFYQQIWANQDESTKLADIRDSLLPKLMSGEIDVSDIDL